MSLTVIVLVLLLNRLKWISSIVEANSQERVLTGGDISFCYRTWNSAYVMHNIIAKAIISCFFFALSLSGIST